MHYRYQKEVKRRAKETAVVSSIVGLLFLAGALYLVSGDADALERVFGYAFGFLSLTVLVVMLLWTLLLFSRSGGWFIEVADTGVIWQAPSGIGERSFRFEISELDRVVCVPSTEAELESTYYLVTKAQERIPLKPSQSGVNIHKFIASLVDRGVAYEEKS